MNNELSQCVLTVIDLFNNFVIYLPIAKNYTSYTIAQLLIEHVFNWVGSVSVLLTDNGKTLISPLLIDIFQLLNIKHYSICPRQSTTQGRVELANKLLLKSFRYVSKIVTISDLNLGMLCAITGLFLNNLQTPKMPCSPYFIMFGTEPKDIF